MNSGDLLTLLSQALKINRAEINLNSMQQDIEEWDSLGHLNILVQLDKATEGKASLLPELVEAKSVEDFIKVLSKNNLLELK